MRCHSELCGLYLFYPLAFPAIHTVRLVINPDSWGPLSACSDDGQGFTFLQRLAPHTVVYRDVLDLALISEKQAYTSREIPLVAVISAKRLVMVIPAMPVKRARGLKAEDMWRLREMYPFVEEVKIVLQSCGGYMDSVRRPWTTFVNVGGGQQDHAVFAARWWIREAVGMFCAWWPTRVRLVGAEGVRSWVVYGPLGGGPAREER
ncbi:hypothetical protein IAT38_005516 [Cryptococcus sp. DSM 104549]